MAPRQQRAGYAVRPGVRSAVARHRGSLVADEVADHRSASARRRRTTRRWLGRSGRRRRPRPSATGRAGRRRGPRRTHARAPSLNGTTTGPPARRWAASSRQAAAAPPPVRVTASSTAGRHHDRGPRTGLGVAAEPAGGQLGAEPAAERAGSARAATSRPDRPPARPGRARYRHPAVTAAVRLVDREHGRGHHEQISRNVVTHEAALRRGAVDRASDERARGSPHRTPGPRSPTHRAARPTPTTTSRGPEGVRRAPAVGDPAGQPGARGRAHGDARAA